MNFTDYWWWVQTGRVGCLKIAQHLLPLSFLFFGFVPGTCITCLPWKHVPMATYRAVSMQTCQYFDSPFFLWHFLRWHPETVRKMMWHQLYPRYHLDDFSTENTFLQSFALFALELPVCTSWWQFDLKRVAKSMNLPFSAKIHNLKWDVFDKICFP